MTAWDDYFWPGTTVLANKLGITDSDLLAEAEYILSSRRAQEITAGTIEIDRSFDADHLKALHGHLFGDLYEWAGQFRGVDIAKGGLPFASTDRIDMYLADVTHIVETTPWPDLDRPAFTEHMAKVYAHLNTAHGFREGNGRTGKLFLSQLAEQTSYDLDFERIDPALWNQQSALSRPDLGQYTPYHSELVPVFDRITIDRTTDPAPTTTHEHAQHHSIAREPITYEQHPEPPSYQQHPDTEISRRGFAGPESPGHHRGLNR